LAAVQAPPGVASDDPFGGTGQPAQLIHLAPSTVEMADVAAGKTSQQIAASVHAVMSTAPSRKSAASMHGEEVTQVGPSG
jgi:hypothetical protein